MHLRKRFAAGLLAGLLLLTGCAGSGNGGGAPSAAAPEPNAGPPEFRAVWVSTVYNLDYPASPTTDAETLRAEADAILQNCAAMGMTAVILQVRPSADALYPSALYPWSRYLTGAAGTAPEDGFDPLAYWVERAHGLGLELHAWINPFRITKQGAEELEALGADSPAKLHPEWVVECEGQYYFNPGIPQARELVVQGAEELARNYQVDGVHLDDYFYPSRSFDDEAAFTAYGGDFATIGDWRRDNVNQLIRSLDQRLHAIDPELSFGVSPSGVWADRKSLPEGSDTTGGYESYFSAYADSRRWVREGWVDYICPQIYWYIGHPKLDYETIARWWTDTVAGTGVELYIGMADYMADDGKEGSPWLGLDALQAQLGLNQALGVDGEVHFRYKFLAGNANLTALYQDFYLGPTEVELSIPFLAELPRAERLHWAAESFGTLGELGLVTGYPDGTFRPDEKVERSSMTKLVYGAMQRRGLAVPALGGGTALPGTEGTWAQDYIAALNGAGYLAAEDYPGGFDQAGAMTRMEMVRLLVRAIYGPDDGSVTSCRYADVTEPGDFYYVEKAAEYLIWGYPDGLFHPGDTVDRGQAATILCRFIEGS